MTERPSRTLEILEAVEAGSLCARDALELLARLPGGEVALGFARVDTGRQARCGFPEVVFCQGKRPEEAAAIAAEVAARAGRVLLTRAGPEVHREVLRVLPGARFEEKARCVTFRAAPPESFGFVAVLAAGTADIPVAEEARVAAEMMDARVGTWFDVGVAGLHRLMGCIEEVREATAVVVAAGMDGALPSVVGGLVDRPVLAVPTSVGYGSALGGLAALLTALNSCAAGVAVVNVDNGFGAGYFAGLINRLAVKGPSRDPSPP